MSARVVVLDYGSGNVHSAVRALERVGADVELTADPEAALAADGLFVPGVGNFHACMRGLRAVDGPRLIDLRLAGGRPVLGVCVGMQVLFDGSSETNVAGRGAGLGEWPGIVDRLPAAVVPHMGWSEVTVPAGSRLFAGVEHERFYFVHSYAAQKWELERRGPLRRGRAQGDLGRARRAVRGRRRERPAVRPPSSTPRSPATRAPTCCATGWSRCDPPPAPRASRCSATRSPAPARIARNRKGTELP